MVYNHYLFFKEASRMFKRKVKVKKAGFKKYKGDAKEICRQVIEDCWNKEKKYFQVSAGHFNLFYTRDFSWCTKPLINLGYEDQVIQTLSYCLDIFEKYGKVTVAISPEGKPFDFPRYSVDSLPYLIRSLKQAKAYSLISKHQKFLEKEIKRFHDTAIDISTGMIRENTHFSSIKDHHKRSSCCYDNTMLAMLSFDLKELRLYNPMREYDYRKLIQFSFWNRDYFIEEHMGPRHVSGDSNIFPFWSGVFKDKSMLKRVIEKIRESGIDKPFPLKYSEKKDALEDKNRVKIKSSVFAKDYEEDSIWMHMGPIYIGIVKEADKKLAEEYINKYIKIIERYQNYLEVFNSKGEPYSTMFYCTDESMLWSSIFLDILSCKK